MIFKRKTEHAAGTKMLMLCFGKNKDEMVVSLTMK